jgi:transaldolase
MSLLLDSAQIEDARAAAELGFVRGATTNPTLLERAGRPAEEVIPALCDLLPGIVYYQLTAPDVAGRAAEARRMAALRPGRIGLKIPCTDENLALAARLTAEGHVVGITAIFHPGQVFLAGQVGARCVLPYVNRSTRLLGDGPGLVRRMRAVIDSAGLPLELIAASVKDPDEAEATLAAGAHGLTLPLAVIRALASHPLSEAAIAEFALAAQGASGSA